MKRNVISIVCICATLFVVVKTPFVDNRYENVVDDSRRIVSPPWEIQLI